MGRWQATLARAGIHTSFGRDAVGAGLVLFVDVGLGLVGYAQAVLPRPPAAAFGLQLTLAAVAAGSLAWRRQAPRAVLAVVVAAVLGSGLVYAEPSTGAGSAFALLIAAYTTGAYCRRRSGLAALGTAAAAGPLWGLVVLGLPALPFGADPDPARLMLGFALGPVLSVVLAGLFGAFVVGQREQRARQAVIEDRARIARELHDVAAHHLSAIVVQAGAAERQAHDNPEEARRVLAEIREQGSTTLAQMRGLIGGLRDDERDEPGAAPGLARADRLIDEACRAGCDVAFTVEGEPRQPLPPAVDFAGYRVLQESLSNARRHAPGAPVQARVAYHADTVEVEVGNAAAPDAATPSEAGTGQGLAGMRERVALAGGELAAGPTTEGGWRVHATLPANERQPAAVAVEHEPQQVGR